MELRILTRKESFIRGTPALGVIGARIAPVTRRFPQDNANCRLAMAAGWVDRMIEAIDPGTGPLMRLFARFEMSRQPVPIPRKC